MRFMIIHKTNAHWESGALPDPELCSSVGAMVGELARRGTLLAAEGLRPSSMGLVIEFDSGQRTVRKGPFFAVPGVATGFTIVNAQTVEDAAEYASRFARVLGDVAIEVRPVTEPWDLGFGPAPDPLPARRFMAIYKTSNVADAAMSYRQSGDMRKLVRELAKSGVLLSAQWPRSGVPVTRVTQRDGELSVTDGPFVETKEVIGGFVMVRMPTDEARRWLIRYAKTVGAQEIDLLELLEDEELGHAAPR